MCVGAVVDVVGIILDMCLLLLLLLLMVFVAIVVVDVVCVFVRLFACSA